MNSKSELSSLGEGRGLGFVLPTYREEKNIARLLAELRERFPDARIEIVDDSPDLATQIAAEDHLTDRVRLTHRETKKGRGSAVLQGLLSLLAPSSDRACEWPECEWLIEMDTDFSHLPEEVISHLAYAKLQKLDLLIASRYLPESEIVGWPMGRRIFSKLANHLAKISLQVPVHDYTNGFRIYSRRAAEELVQTCGKHGGGFIALSEILVLLYYRGFRVGERATCFVNRTAGQSSFSAREVLSSLTGLAKIIRFRFEVENAEGSHAQEN